MNNQERIAKYKERDTFARLARCVSGFGAYHRSYCCYATLDRVVQMMGVKFHRLWLTRSDVGLFDDGIEHMKYGLKSERERTYRIEKGLRQWAEKRGSTDLLSCRRKWENGDEQIVYC